MPARASRHVLAKDSGTPLSVFHPAVKKWFEEDFPAGPTPAQVMAWPRIAAGKNILLVSPTGTGKTLAAFLVAMDRILKRRLSGDSERRLATLYISPLKALDNDIHRNLERPRNGIRGALSTFSPGLPEIDITAEIRTGDTPSSVRLAQIRRPPDILITTPESLYLMLTGSARRILEGVDTVILDEIHSVAGNKRGVHLSLTLERLEDLVASAGGPSPQRIALSATVSPVETVAAMAAGDKRAIEPLISGTKKRLELTVTSPSADFRDLPDGSAWGPALESMVREIKGRKTTLVFCNNRRLSERVSRKLTEALDWDVPTHHGSIARPVREGIERNLKAGELPVLVATGSLELGLDVGHVDAVIQVESPKGIARGLQRVGRSGHLVGEAARGLFVPLFLNDLFECAATAEAMVEGAVEATVPPEFPLDVLAQQIVAEAVARSAGGVSADQLFSLFRRAYPYRNLKKPLFLEVLSMLSGKYPKERFAELAPKLVWDRATGRVSPLPGARLSALLDGGTIGDRGTFSAVLRDRRTTVGELDEEFVYETRAGDVFLLGARAWKAVEITNSHVVVEDATGQPARMPFWRGEGLGRTGALGERIGKLKRMIAGHLDDPDLATRLHERYAVTESAAAAMTGAVRREILESGGLSCDQSIVFETFPNEIGDPCVVVRSLFGRGVNLPWSLVLSSVLRDETGVEVETVASDDGILLRTPRAEREMPLGRLSQITSAEARERLIAILPNSPMFGARFRENAQRALLLPRKRGGRRTPFWLQRLKARDLLETTRSFPDFPIVAETYRDCWRDIWEVDRLLALLTRLEEGSVKRVLVTRKTPSPAAASLLFRFIAAYMYEWDAPKAEKSIHALAANRALLGEVLGQSLEDGIRPEAVETARAEASRLVPHRMARTAEELLLIFQELGDLTWEEIQERASAEAAAWLEGHLKTGAVTGLAFPGGKRYVLAEEARLFQDLGSGRVNREDLDNLLARFLSTRGPASAEQASQRYRLAPAAVEESLERLRLEGRVLAGRFGGAETVWAGTRIAELIRRRTLNILRREIQPVPVTVYREFLARRQGATAGSRFAGPAAPERAVAMLRGLPLPFQQWELALLPARLTSAEPDALDVLSARGLLVWRAIAEKDLKYSRLQLFFRGEGTLFLPGSPRDLDALSSDARSLYEALGLSGASFLSDLAGATGKPPSTTLTALKELVRAGLVTGDGLLGFRELLKTSAKRMGPHPAEPAPGHMRKEFGRFPGRPALRAAEQRIEARVGRAVSLPREALSGRWSLVSAPSVLGPPLAPGEREETWAQLLLARWGVVCRETIERESAITWSSVAPVLARLEMAGDLRRGEFIEGLGPMQYAEPQTVDELRRRRDDAQTGNSLDEGLTVASGCDPVLFALKENKDRDQWVVLTAGDVAFRISESGTLTRSREDLPFHTLKDGLSAVQDVLKRGRDPLARPRKLKIASIGSGRPAAGSPLSPVLESLGFTRDMEAYTWRAL